MNGKKGNLIFGGIGYLFSTPVWINDILDPSVHHWIGYALSILSALVLGGAGALGGILMKNAVKYVHRKLKK